MSGGLDAVIVTGAGRGLGKAVTERCVKLNIPVVCISKSERAPQIAAQLRALGGKAESLIMDLGDITAVHTRVEEWLAATRYRRLAVVLAAGTLGQAGGLIDGDLRDWLSTYQCNVVGNLAVLQALLPVMLDARFGRIVTVAGGGAAYAFPLFSGYALSKTAIVRATENLQAELKGKGDFLTVCLAPGAMDTDMLRQVRAVGAEVRTTVAMEEPVEFITQFILAESSAFAGRFVHVRDDWKSKLNQPVEVGEERWYLRRIE